MEYKNKDIDFVINDDLLEDTINENETFITYLWKQSIEESIVMPGKLSLHFKIVVYGKTSEQHSFPK
jgi:hypothetical protein